MDLGYIQFGGDSAGRLLVIAGYHYEFAYTKVSQAFQGFGAFRPQLGRFAIVLDRFAGSSLQVHRHGHVPVQPRGVRLERQRRAAHGQRLVRLSQLV